MSDDQILPPHAFAAVRDGILTGLGREPEPSEPTLGHGAPDLGTDWAWNWGHPDGQPTSEESE